MKNTEDINFLRNSVKDEVTVPESLSKENITELVSGEKAGKSKKGVLRRFVAVGIAACLMITAVSFLWDKGLFSAPENLISDDAVTENTENSVAQNTAGSYDELLSFIKDYAEEYKKNVNRGYLYFSVTDDGAIIDESKAESAVDMMGAPTYNSNITSDSVAENEMYGEVNLREYGVKEADIFITDGQYLYCIDTYSRRLRIVRAAADGTLESMYEGNESLIKSDGNGDDVYYSGLYIYENYLIAGFTHYCIENHRTKTGNAGVQIYDISDKSNPVLKKEIAIDGSFVSSRIIDSSLVLVTRYSIIEQFEETDDTALLPSVYNGDMKYNVPCDCIVYSEKDVPETYVNIAKLDLSDIEREPTVSSYLGKVSDTYCTRDTLYVIGYNYNYGNGTDDVALFGRAMLVSDVCTVITKADISGEKAEIKCRTEFNGSILNSYSIDEYNGFLRVAVTTIDDENCIYVFDESLGKVGEITGIAEGEQIKSARFMGDTAYVVTFVQTDPLFVIDLSDPENPVIKGEVKLPGFSSYLHPAGDGLLVGIGVGGTETGTDGSSKISLFDVSDPTSPKEIDSLSFPTSSIGTESKAFCSVTDTSFLVTYANWTAEASENYMHYTGALYVGVKDNKLELKNSYILLGGESVSRVTFIGDKIYVFSEGEAGIASFDMNTGAFIDTKACSNAYYCFTASDRPNSDILN